MTELSARHVIRHHHEGDPARNDACHHALTHKDAALAAGRPTFAAVDQYGPTITVLGGFR